MDKESLRAFCAPYYAGKDIMHDLWHIGLVERWVERVIALGGYEVDREKLAYATWFHGFIYSDEPAVRRYLREQGMPESDVETVVRIAWESQRPTAPETLEGKVLHDAHVLEGGRVYAVVKTLITGSVRGQTLLETLRYMRANQEANRCYLPETIPLCEEMNAYTKAFTAMLEEGIREAAP